MRILVVQESDWLEKGPHQQHHLMEKLSLRSHEIRVVDYEISWRKHWNGELHSKRRVFNDVSKIYNGVSVTLIRPSIIKVPHLDYVSLVFSHGREIVRQIEEFRPDVIVGFGILNTYLAFRLAKAHNIPFVYYLIDALHTLVPFKPYKPIAREMERRILKGADMVLAINEGLKDYAVMMGADARRTSVIRAGVDLERFNSKVDGEKLRYQYGIKNEDVVLLFMGWLYAFSGLREVALKLLEVREEYPYIKLLIVGEGELYPELREIKEKRDLEQLILVGRQPYEKIPEFIAASDICLLPAHKNEVMKNIVPIKMYEYLAGGKPVISTRLLGVMREFGDDNGVTYVSEPAEVIGKAIELIENGNLAEYGRKARRFVERYKWDVIAEEFIMLLEEFCEMKRQKNDRKYNT